MTATTSNGNRRHHRNGAFAIAVILAGAGIARADEPSARGEYPTPLQMGQFKKMLMGAHTVVPADERVTKAYFGLHHTDTFFDAMLTGSSGQFYFISNVVMHAPDGKLQAASWIGASHSSQTGLQPDGRYTPPRGEASQTLNADQTITYSLPKEEFTFGTTSFAWKTADGSISVTGKLVGAGTQWLLPSRAADGSTDLIYYVEQGYAVEGTYFHEKVHGHIILETMWGNEDYGESWWVKHRVGHFGLFTINYADGTSEYGQLFCGLQGDQGAVLANNQGEEVTYSDTVDVEVKPNGVYRYHLRDGAEWEFVSNPGRGFGRRLGDIEFDIGSTRRLHEKRQVVSADAIMITPHSMCRAPGHPSP